MAFKIPLDLTMREIPNSVAVENKIRQKSEKLAKFYNHIEFCKVVIDIIQKHKHQGKLFDARIELGVPGKRLVVSHQRNQDLYVSIRDAFDAMQRQLEGYANKQRGHVKNHLMPTSGHVIRLFEDYGFIEAFDGREFYFHKNNLLLVPFETIQTGMLVHFLEAQMGESLQATHINAVNLEGLDVHEDTFVM